MEGYTNSTFLSLVPKESNPSIFSRFRPISLCNASYKILSEITANRLKLFLPRLVSENHGGFMENRQIVDNIILVQEAIHSRKSNKERGMAIKIDMENAFDRVNHAFLCKVLNRFVFYSSFFNGYRLASLNLVFSPW
jgi:hypothetical protein